MIYQGSKNRISKHILPIILKDRKPGQWYVEPFVGGGNLIDKVEGPRIGADLNPFVIEALKLIRDRPEDLPHSLSPEEYEDLKMFQPLNGITGVLGFACSFGSKWFGGYARGSSDNYAANARNSALKQSANLKGVIFINSSYQLLDVPPESVVYLDPPYKGTTGYKTGSFDSAALWDWARCMSRRGHSVFVSEYQAPEDFYPVWEGEITTSYSTSKSLKATEKLFVFNDLY